MVYDGPTVPAKNSTGLVAENCVPPVATSYLRHNDSCRPPHEVPRSTGSPCTNQSTGKLVISEPSTFHDPYSAGPGETIPYTRVLTGQQATSYTQRPRSSASHIISQQATTAGPQQFNQPLPTGGQQATHDVMITHMPQLHTRGQQATYSEGIADSQQLLYTADTRQVHGGLHEDTQQEASPSYRHIPEFLRVINYPDLPDTTKSSTAHYAPADDYDALLPACPPASIKDHTSMAQLHRSWPFPSPSLPRHLTDIYEAARQAERLQDPTLRRPITTSLNTDEWRVHTTGHEDDDWLMDAIQFGFPIQYVGPPQYNPPLLYNHASAVNYSMVIKQYIQTETAQGALHGPFHTPPFTPWMVFSPMMTREKPDSTDRRVIVDLSYPDGGINQHITPHLFNGHPAVHNLPTVEDAVAAINKYCPGEVNLAVIDLSRAYRQFPVPPTDWPLLGIQHDGQYFCDGRLPFGARLSAFAMQSVARFILRAMAAIGIQAFMYLDDILLISGSASQAERHFAQTLSLLAALGLQVAAHKLQRPSPMVTWLGVNIDIHHNRLSIPDTKLAEIHKCLAAAARQPRISLRHLQSILGFINHLAKVVRAARIFICRLLAALRATKDDVILITPHVKADLAWFLRFLSKNNARAILPHNRTVLRLWADSSLRGAGATDGTRCYAYDYPDQVAATHHITQLEALNVLAAVRTFVNPIHAAGTVEIYSDNMASVHTYSSGRARDPVLAACCRAMWYHAAATQTDLRFAHMPGEAMVLPDALSRSSFDPKLRSKAESIIQAKALTRVNVKRAAFNYSQFM